MNRTAFKFLAILLIFLYILFSHFIISYVGSYAWDDGAITLAYGKTLGTVGKYALTASSEIVEGSSSNFIVFLTAIFVKVFSPDFYQTIRFSQYNTLFFTVVTMLLTFRFLKKLNFNDYVNLLIVGILGIVPMFLMEMCNGMEMTALSAFLLLFLWCYEKKSQWIFPVIAILLLIRFETIFYLCFSLFAQIVFNKNERNYLIKLLVFTLLFFSVTEMIRYFYFGALVPNTITAKMNPPYSRARRIKWEGGIEFIKNYFFPLLLLLFVIITTQVKKSFGDIKFWFIISFLVFSLVSGTNSGYLGRMTFAVYPFIIIMLCEKLQQTSFSFRKKYLLIVAVSVLTLASNCFLYKKIYETTIFGGFSQNKFLPAFFKDKVKKLDLSKYDSESVSMVTPENYRLTGKSVDSLRTVLKLKEIKFMVPDVGGLGLGFDKINIIDSALLTNKELAKKGYSYFETYLSLSNPDVIETHGAWTKWSNIYSLEYFKNNFVPIIFDNSFFWLNKKYIDSIKNNGDLSFNYLEMNDIKNGVRYFYKEEIQNCPPLLNISKK